MIELYIIEDWKNKLKFYENKQNTVLNAVKDLLDIDIIKNDKGKPIILNEKKFINWSHNDDYLAIAFSVLGNIGVDIEDSNIIYEKSLYGWILHEEEKNKLKNGILFSEIWTRKEAILKCSGEGIHDNMNELNSYDNNNFINSFIKNDFCISICSEFKESFKIIEI